MNGFKQNYFFLKRNGEAIFFFFLFCNKRKVIYVSSFNHVILLLNSLGAIFYSFLFQIHQGKRKPNKADIIQHNIFAHAVWYFLWTGNKTSSTCHIFLLEYIGLENFKKSILFICFIKTFPPFEPFY
jgi:hypothetical protein